MTEGGERWGVEEDINKNRKYPFPYSSPIKTAHKIWDIIIISQYNFCIIK